MKLRRLNNRGDTIIEVMLALGLLSLILMSAWALTNRVTIISQSTTKRIDMVNQLKAQAEMLTSEQNRRTTTNPLVGDGSKPDTLINSGSYVSSDTSALMPLATQCQSGLWQTPVVNDISAKAFYLTPPTNPADGIASQPHASNPGGDTTSKMWIEAYNTEPGSVDFYIRGCWQTNSNATGVSNAEIFLRLNT